MRIVSKPNAGDAITGQGGVASNEMQVFMDDLQQQLNNNLLGDSVRLPAYTIATMPAPAKNTGGQIFVSDEIGGAVPAFSDGTNWRRVTDRAIVS